MTPAEILDWSIYATFVMVMLSLAIAFIRLAKGPTLADRVVALDMMTILIIAVCGVVAVATGVFAMLDVALVLALVGFLATVALARYAERRDVRQNGDDA
ncbi:monovalent cation/H+ antiporter complex subunit F [Roseobacter sp. CCS2]|uniref:monovalent cation/H+ antiporter complex subunit F n=1 Tax=Roseobacter sp. CCS2 TaxID=391593 RepID=UPI0000F3E5A2|nr:monovalent cation/H+ antiporter complex subunit F [Roseobacter sp. CCS2]EBA11044.1 multiple resistance and pH regulation protein F [Roseobacter sp. CCS2]